MIDIGKGRINSATYWMRFDKFSNTEFVCVFPNARFRVRRNQTVAKDAVNHMHVELNALKEMDQKTAYPNMRQE